MKRTEREMLVLAAKAIGRNLDLDRYDDDMGFIILGISRWWNPLNHDGHALQLAAKLKIDLEWQHDDDAVEAYVRVLEGSTYCPSYPSSEYRRAIVDVAAKLGESMP